jgi:predicted transcriptional regulator
LGRLCADYPYKQFPLVINGQLVGLIGRNKILNNQSSKIEADPAEAIAAHATIREAVAKMVENSTSLLVVLSTTGNAPIGIVTLHDVFRLHHPLDPDCLTTSGVYTGKPL